MSLPVDQLVELLKPGGLFSHHSPSFEYRPGQVQMLEEVCRAINQDQIALIEAGTGIGKSLAYLLPAIYFAVANQERVVISTNTISLQEQLLYKDIPQIKEILGWEFKATLVKGMGNYVCQRRLREATEELTLFSTEEEEELHRIKEWENVTLNGSLSDVPFTPSSTSWEKINVELDTCLFQKCPHYETCFYFKARKEAEEAQILIVNHHLLFADLAIKKQLGEALSKKGGLLPPYTRLILDEAHNLEDVATDYFAKSFSKNQVRKQVGRLCKKGKRKEGGKFTLLAKQLGVLAEKKNSEELRAAEHEISLKSEAFRESTLASLAQFYTQLDTFLYEAGHSAESAKFRILPHHLLTPVWKAKIVGEGKELAGALSQWRLFFDSIFNHLKEELDTYQREKFESLFLDISAVCDRLADLGDTLLSTINEEIHEEGVRFFEYRSRDDAVLCDANLDISKRLAEDLFKDLPSTILCSATLTTSGNFEFFKKRTGLHEEVLKEKVVSEVLLPSPFDYENQALIATCDDLPAPSAPQFYEKALEVIFQALVASRGNAFVLFTSYKMMNQCFYGLQSALKERGFHPFRQGEKGRTQLLADFQKTEGSILFGTDSFWEGVDVAGDALRLVILVKLPFKVPNEPIVEARCELIEKGGKSPFMEYVVPNAIVKFKQGFGRLIRHKLDKGCILCLDSRLRSKGYGKAFLKSLPPCHIFHGKSEEVIAEVRKFYRKRAYAEAGKS